MLILTRKYNYDKVATKGIKVLKEDRSIEEQVIELRKVLRGLINSYEHVFCYSICSLPVCESGNPKLGTFGDFKNKYNEKGELIKK